MAQHTAITVAVGIGRMKRDGGRMRWCGYSAIEFFANLAEIACISVNFRCCTTAPIRKLKNPEPA